jgi:translation initiation factor IF-2
MKVKQDLLQHGVVLEDFGGDVMSADVSAKQGMGMDDLLEKVLLQAEILELRANPNREAHGVVIEAQLDVGKGPVATVLVTNGTLRVGDHVVCGLYSGRIRALLDERGNAVDKAGPGDAGAGSRSPRGTRRGRPARGHGGRARDRDLADAPAPRAREADADQEPRREAHGLSKMLARASESQLNLVIKGDVDGSVQALSDSLEQLSTEEVGCR